MRMVQIVNRSRNLQDLINAIKMEINNLSPVMTIQELQYGINILRCKA